MAAEAFDHRCFKDGGLKLDHACQSGFVLSHRDAQVEGSLADGQSDWLDRQAVEDDLASRQSEKQRRQRPMLASWRSLVVEQDLEKWRRSGLAYGLQIFDE
jgi:hypothetical protein